MVVHETSITVANVVNELAKLGFSNMKHYVGKTQDGRPHIDLTHTTDDQWAAIQELSSDTYNEGKGEDAKRVVRTKIKLHGKESALVSIGKHLGMFDKERERGSATDAPEVPKAPSAERLEEMRRRYMPNSKPHLEVIEGGRED